MKIDRNAAPLLETSLPALKPFKQGKVRDVYDLGDRLLIVATDRLSAFDVVLPTGIPGKGVVLTQMSLFWFRLLADVVPNHVLTADIEDYGPELQPYRDQLEGRSMIVTKAEALPVECVVRGYLAGSGWKEYQQSQTVCGIELPGGLVQCSQLPEPIFTPATKAAEGHDENISFERMVDAVGQQTAEPHAMFSTIEVRAKTGPIATRTDPGTADGTGSHGYGYSQVQIV